MAIRLTHLVLDFVAFFKQVFDFKANLATLKVKWLKYTKNIPAPSMATFSWVK